MKKIILSLLCLSVAAPLLADGTNQLTDEKSRVSYAIGMALGQNSFKRQGVTVTTNEVDFDLVAQGMKAVATGGTPVLTDMEAQQALQAFSKQMQAMRATEGLKVKAAGDAFLAANAKNPGVQTLPDGLQYLVITNGTGAIPTPADTVSVNYRGTLIDGTEFDSSYKRGKPADFPVSHVIPGWTEALEKMNVGSKWKLFIPSQLAYGERGTQGIPPNSVLVFDVELLDTKTPPPPAPPAPLTSDIIKVPSAAEMKNGAKIEVIKPGDVPATQTATGK